MSVPFGTPCIYIFQLKYIDIYIATYILAAGRFERKPAGKRRNIFHYKFERHKVHYEEEEQRDG